MSKGIVLCDFSDFSCTERGKSEYYSGFNRKKSARRWYQHDIDTIIYSEMFRKMQRKSQLFSMGDPVSRSRLIHTFEVVRIAKEISDRLGLNSELTEAIALAHDFGNVAYGKVADDFLRTKTKHKFKHEDISALMLKVSASRSIPDRFRKEANSKIGKNRELLHKIKITEFPHEIEVYEHKNSKYYVSISPELLDGVRKHGSDGTKIYTLEGQVVNYADNIAYLIQDVNDFCVTGIFTPSDIKRYGESLEDLAGGDTNKLFPITDIVGETTSMRTAVLIERFISYNLNRLTSGAYKTNMIYSPFLSCEIPILEIEPLVKEAIDRCWEFKNEFYGHELIKLSNINSKLKIEQIWSLLDESSLFREKNDVCNKFMSFLEMPVFKTYRRENRINNEETWQNWKKACFIAHLTCDEIDLIIESALARDYSIEFSMPTISVH